MGNFLNPDVKKKHVSMWTARKRMRAVPHEERLDLGGADTASLL